ncbi:DarT ssDNA thymidine ADP-ribosyltransferase family protein [Luteimonas fraxinea]|uniref:DarT ssDNA thymidine ADP-ribosyltransferase family protein n=1 Tax=Luteimonas fraxinea TaxID=2901869 RepID=UPI001E38772E|nr:DarT ssDNA thymidine ADP-ribosyltransferase family protein [Luteimonas fraxinea]MCD9126989.1 DUF4433 domain-containing protein [Luteimonas fraxinea]
MTPDEFFRKFSVKCFYHFTDLRNVSSIKERGGLLSMHEMKRRGIAVPAPGGSVASQRTDAINGMDKYVHLCFFNQNPMEYRAKEGGRIEESKFLEVSREVICVEGVLFTSTMSNVRGAVAVDLVRASQALDFDAIYGKVDWSDLAQRGRVVAARKYEILVPGFVDIKYLRNI